MKASIVLCSLFLLAIAVNAQPDDQSAGVKKPSGMTRTQFQKMSDLTTGRRKIAIAPVAAASGINSGVVVAYGHVIPPPYHVEYSNGNRLLINGVQVTPSLVKERHRREQPIKGLSPEKQAIQDRIGKIGAPIKDIYEEGKRTGSIDAAKKRILDLLLQHPDLFQHPKWQGQELCYETPVYPGSQCVGFGPSTFGSPETIARNEEKNKAMEIAQIEMELKHGQWVCFGSMGGTHVLRVSRDAVEKVMKDTTLTKEQRIDRLEGIVDDFDVAFDIVENYDDREWHEAK